MHVSSKIHTYRIIIIYDDSICNCEVVWYMYIFSRNFVTVRMHAYMYMYFFIKALGSGNSEANGQSSEQPSPGVPTVKPHPPEEVDQALLKTPPKRTTGTCTCRRMYVSLLLV